MSSYYTVIHLKTFLVRGGAGGGGGGMGECDSFSMLQMNLPKVYFG